MKKIIAVLVVIFVLFAVYLLKTDIGLTQKLLASGGVSVRCRA